MQVCSLLGELRHHMLRGMAKYNFKLFFNLKIKKNKGSSGPWHVRVCVCVCVSCSVMSDSL